MFPRTYVSSMHERRYVRPYVYIHEFLYVLEFWLHESKHVWGRIGHIAYVTVALLNSVLRLVFRRLWRQKCWKHLKIFSWNLLMKLIAIPVRVPLQVHAPHYQALLSPCQWWAGSSSNGNLSWAQRAAVPPGQSRQGQWEKTDQVHARPLSHIVLVCVC